MITTPDLIDSLARGVTPVRRLRPPLIRALGWLLLAAIILGLLAVSQGLARTCRSVCSRPSS